MGISMISNVEWDVIVADRVMFQSPMGISMISNKIDELDGLADGDVSIPNGDKHDFKHERSFCLGGKFVVSIPNGDKHDFKHTNPRRCRAPKKFQSPMGISMISNSSEVLP